MKWTIRENIVAGVIGILLLGLSSMLAIYAGFRVAERAMHEVADVEEPTSAAAYEMEINVIGTGLGVLKYLDTGDPQYRDRVEKDEADFVRFKARYDQLAETAAGKELGNKVGVLFGEFVQLGRVLMDQRDERETLFRAIAENFEVIDGILDEEIQENLDEAGPDGQEKVIEAAAMEGDIAEVGAWLGNYLRVPTPAYRERIFNNARDFRVHLAEFKNLRLSETEIQRTSRLEKIFSRTFSMIQKDLALHDELQEQVRQFLALREQMDYVLDEEIQTLTMKDLDASKRMAEEAHVVVIRTVAFLLPAFLALGGAVGLMIFRSINNPLRQLMEGTSAVAAGDMTYRMPSDGRDEFARVGQNFNRMVSQLETTTVSKVRLEMNEERLREANSNLRNEIGERRRVEEKLKFLARELVRSNKELQDFASVAAHDLQEPLRKVRVFGDRLKAKCGEALGERGGDYLARMQSATGRMQILINDLLSLSRVTTRARPFVSINLGKVVRRVLSDLEVRVEQTGGRVEVGELPSLEADPTQIRQLLQNLIGNALKFHRKDVPPLVKVHAEHLHGNGTGLAADSNGNGKCCRIIVEDNGIGFDEKYLGLIFTVFQRLHGRSEYEGTGVGLAICRKIAERHGGYITAKSTPGKGASFLITLPLQQARKDGTV